MALSWPFAVVNWFLSWLLSVISVQSRPTDCSTLTCSRIYYINSSLRKYICKHTHTKMCPFTHTQAHTYAYTHTYICGHTHPLTHTPTHVYMHVYKQYIPACQDQWLLYHWWYIPSLLPLDHLATGCGHLISLLNGVPLVFILSPAVEELDTYNPRLGKCIRERWTYTHAQHPDTHTDTYTDTHTHAQICVHLHAHMHTHMHLHTHTHNTYLHLRIRDYYITDSIRAMPPSHLHPIYTLMYEQF